MTLDDLGRAGYEAEWRAVLAKDREPPPYTDIDRPAARAGALAVVERLVEALDDDTDINSLLSSLRAEAGQNTNAAQPQKDDKQ